MNVQGRDITGQELRTQLRESFGVSHVGQFLGKPRISFRLRREYSNTTLVLAFDFFVEFHQLSGTYMRPASITGGCVSIDGVPDRETDRNGVDFQKLFLSSAEYFRFNKAFGVERIYFHGFDRPIASMNHPITYYFDDRGHPIVDRSSDGSR